MSAPELNEVLGERQNEHVIPGTEDLPTHQNLSRWERASERLRKHHTRISIFVVFFAVFNVACFATADEAHFAGTRAATELLVETGGPDSFRGVADRHGFWAYAKGPLVTALSEHAWHESKDLVDDKQRASRDYRLLGAVRIRQVRVRNDSCVVKEVFRDKFSTCYNYYSGQAEERGPLDLGNGHVWLHHTADELGGGSYGGSVSTYGGGGYFQDFPFSRSAAIDTISRLEDRKWISQATRAVFVDFVFSNANAGLLFAVKLLVEFPPLHSAIPSWYIDTFKVIRYSTSFYLFILACEIAVVVFTLFYATEAIYEIILLRFRFFTQFWNILDLAIVVSVFAWAILKIVCYFREISVLDSLENDNDRFTNFDQLVVGHLWYTQLKALALFLTWIKFLKFTKFREILYRAYWMSFEFVIILFHFVLVNAIFAYVLFASSLDDYSTFISSMFSLMKIMVHDFDYQSLKRVQPLLGPIFFFEYVLVLYAIVLNMFLAVIYDAFGDLRKGIPRNSKGDNMWQPGAGSTHERAGQRMYDALIEYNFPRSDIELFFIRHNINPHEVESASELAQRLRATTIQNQTDFLELEELYNLLEQADDRVEALEWLLEDVQIDVDLALEELNSRTLKPA
ncbi:polycystin-2-like protein 1 [Bacillus rossius redtenbacheri]|uniref:polycystin-2-like protein 1 n=1 Tax=Bacillus rossius redtenbacheri TaxID=93214 RepID=UPI002FDCA412